MRFILTVGTTRTAAIDGISAAGASGELLWHTPAADAEIVTFGKPIFTPETPVSPSGCPTPALITRAAREFVGFDVTVLDTGLIVPCAAPTVHIGSQPGEDIRESTAVNEVSELFSKSRRFGQSVSDDSIIVGESIPGGTTTALGVLRALGEPYDVSSSLKDNPIELKHEVVTAALESSNLQPGDAQGDPLRAIRVAGDPVLASIMGLVAGAIESNTRVTLAGGTQMIAVGACLRHFGVDQRLDVVTTPFVVNDEAVEFDRACSDLELDLMVMDPRFSDTDHAALREYVEGAGKEGVGMGGALKLANAEGIVMNDLQERTIERYDELVSSNGD